MKTRPRVTVNQKRSLYTATGNFAKSWPSFSKLLAIKSLLKIPPHLKRVATLPCEKFGTSSTHTDRQRPGFLYGCVPRTRDSGSPIPGHDTESATEDYIVPVCRPKPAPVTRRQRASSPIKVGASEPVSRRSADKQLETLESDIDTRSPCQWQLQRWTANQHQNHRPRSPFYVRSVSCYATSLFIMAALC